MFFFAGFLKIIAPGVGFSTIFLPNEGVGVSHFHCAPGVGNLPFQKIPWGIAGGGRSGLELTDTLLKQG